MPLFHRFEHTARRVPDKLAILTPANNLTYAQMMEMVDLFDLNLRRHIGPGRKRIVFASNKAEFFPVMMLLASRSSHSLIFSNGIDLRAQGIAFDHVVSELDPVNTTDTGFIRIRPDWLAPGQDLSPLAAYRPVAGAAEFAFATSGSTGTAKFYPVPEPAFVAALDTARHIYIPDTFTTRHYSTTAPAMRWTQNVAFRHLLHGGSLLALPPDTDAMLNLIDRHGVTTLAVTPAWVEQALATENPAQFLQNIRAIVIAGAYVAPDLMRRLSAHTPARISVSYGATETGGLAAYTYHPDRSYPAGYLGEICDAGFTCTLLDPETRIPTDRPEGLLGVKHPTLLPKTAYLGNTPPSDAFHNGYFIAGDLIRRNGDSLIHLGRTGEVINLGGNKFALHRIESHLQTALPRFRFCALDRKTPDGQDELVLAYSGDTALEPADINATFTGDLRLCRVARTCRLDTLPLTDRGKIDRRALAHLPPGR